MGDYQIIGEVRTLTGKKVSTLRAKEIVPATIYGPNNTPINVQFKYRELQKLLMNAGSTNIIDVIVDGKTIEVLARDVQRDILKGTILHVDFFAVDANSPIRAEIPVVLVGESPVIASRKAILMAGTSSLRIETLPKDLVNKIEVDITTLTAIGSTIYVKDLKFNSGVTVLNDPDEMVAKALQTGAQRATAAKEAAGQ